MELTLFKMLFSSKKSKRKVVKTIDKVDQSPALIESIKDKLKETLDSRCIDHYGNFTITKMRIFSDNSVDCSILSADKSKLTEVELSAADMLEMQFKKKENI